MIRWFTFIAVTLLSAGCASDPKPEPRVGLGDGANANGASGAAAAGANGKNGQQGDGVAVDDRIARACDLPTPYFDFDSARLQPTAEKVLGAIANCFTAGPLKGRSMNLVGHADPRGELHYNFGLGQMRAQRVANYLAQRGLPSARMETTSRGELEATGSDESGWAHDRKVEIFLAD